MNKPSVAVVAALIFDSKKRLLITQRHDHSHLGGFWEFPGGTIESGERPEDALIREIREEVGLRIKVDSLFWHEHFEYDIKNIDIRFYLCRMTPDTQHVVPHDVADYRWVEREMLDEFSFPEADFRLVERLKSLDN